MGLLSYVAGKLQSDGVGVAMADGTVPIHGPMDMNAITLNNGTGTPLTVERSSQVGIRFHNTSAAAKYLSVDNEDNKLTFGSSTNYDLNTEVIINSETGGNNTGAFTKYSDGLLIMYGYGITGADGLVTVTLPRVTLENCRPSITANATSPRYIIYTTASTTNFQVKAYNSAQTVAAVSFSWQVIGRWK